LVPWGTIVDHLVQFAGQFVQFVGQIGGFG